MMESPAKRRKVSPFRSVPAKASEAKPPSQPEPTTPTRASYASPTKASLARSHPNILARSPARRSGGLKRGRDLRDEILAGKGNNEERPVSGGPPRPDTSADDAALILEPQDHTTEERTEKRASFTKMMANAFAAPRAPLTSRQGPAARNASLEAERETSEDDLPPPKEPRLVPRPTVSASQTRNRQQTDELPPTLVQLGLQPAPHKPRGLASSSSPRNSKHGGSSERNRIRRKGGESTSSPLKPKAAAVLRGRQSSPELFVSEQNEIVEEALESDAEREPEITFDMAEEAIEKKSTIAALRAQLALLQADISKLEEFANSSNESSPIDPTLLELLTDRDPSTNVPPQPNQLSDVADQKMLNLFAPADLQLTSTTSTQTIRRQVHTIHHITLQAPMNASFAANFVVTSNSETFAIQNIVLQATYPNLPLRVRHPVLQTWIENRLKYDSFHRFDLGSLIWGMGEYYLQTQKRDRVFRDLTRRLGDLAEASRTTAKLAGDMTLMQHAAKTRDGLSWTTFEIDLDEQLGRKPPRNLLKRTRNPHLNPGPKLLLSWNSDLEWTGSAHPTVDLVTTGLPSTADKGVKEAFGMLVKKAGILEAMERVVTLLGSGGKGGEIVWKGKGRGTRKEIEEDV